MKESLESGFNKPVDLFRAPGWARASNANVELGPTGPVPPQELVSPDGQCAPAPAETAPAPTPAAATAAEQPSGKGAGFEGGLEAGGAPGPSAAPVVGGIALGMTECQAVRRAGTPSNVTIGADEGGERKVVLTYVSGPWPGVYTFSGGRLKVVDAPPEQQKPKPEPKKKRSKRAKSAASERIYVQ